MSTVENEVMEYLKSLPAARQADMQQLHALIRAQHPESKLWFDKGLDEKGKVISNPSIGYGSYMIRYANGKTKEFYRTGISANSSGISVYIMGLKDKSHLADTYQDAIGKASITGYCIRFKNILDIEPAVLLTAIRERMEQE